MSVRQGVKAQTFSMFDYGCELLRCKNQEHYGQKTPPAYDLGNYPAGLPTVLYAGTNDALADPRDVALLLAGWIK